MNTNSIQTSFIGFAILMLCVGTFMPVSAQDKLTINEPRKATLAAPFFSSAPLARVVERPRTLIALQPELKNPATQHLPAVTKAEIVSLKVLVGIYGFTFIAISMLLFIDSKKHSRNKR